MLKTKLGLSIILNLPKYDTAWWLPWQFFQRNTVKMSSLPFDFGSSPQLVLSCQQSVHGQSMGRASVLICVLTDSPRGQNHPRTVHRKGQRADMCSVHGQSTESAEIVGFQIRRSKHHGTL